MADAAWDAKLPKVREDYDRARKLIDNDSLLDPPTEPYRSKYKAREILKELLEVIGSDESTELSRLVLVRALLKYDLGTIAADTDELSLGQEYFEDGLKIIGEDRYEDPKCCMLAIHLLNQLGILYSGREDKSKARDLLKRAEKLYSNIKAQQDVVVYDFTDYFLPEGEQPCSKTTHKNFERAFIHTLYYLAQVYGALEEAEMSAIYCHSTLKKQLATDELDNVDWALNAATLSQFFIVRGDFNAGRHHLACASLVMKQYKDKLDKEQLTPEEREGKEETVNHRSADIARCWAKYGLLLLCASKEALLKVKAGEEKEGRPDQTEAEKKPHVLINSEEILPYEKSVTDKLVTDFQSARPIFLSAQRWLNEAKEYYTLKDHASDYIAIIQETSKLYNALIAFEDAPDRQCKMHKRRIDILEEVLKEVSPRYYINECRQILFELGETYSEMADIKFSQLPGAVQPQSHPVKKINSLIDKAIKNFQGFLETLHDSEKRLPSRLPEEYVRPALLAHFCIGRLNTRRVASDPRDQIENYKTTQTYYDYIVDYCKSHPDHASQVEAELEVVKELLELIPGMIQNCVGTLMY
ncbi:KIF-binding protein-like [Ornithodoros turicata]|uniref:KIF-binding protein-like n=1 Tax=Ornithodoros turicata TaxID=34597 RepID=UPI0031397C44